MPEQITILGNGAMATVCSILLTAGGHGVTMWGAFAESIDRLRRDRDQQRLLPGARVPDAVRLTADDTDALAGATMILSAIPTQHMRSAWDRLAPHVPAGVPVVSVAKGIENGTLLRPTQVVADVLGGCDRNPLAALSGPNIAVEISRHLPATAVAAADDAAVARRVQAAFSTPWFRVYTNDDVAGVELAGATKNVIALAAGILEGLSVGNNAKAALVTRGIVEISRLGAAMGAHPGTFAGLAGLGDLITTCFSPQSRNRTVGERIGKGQKLPQILGEMVSVAEGVETTKGVVQLARRHGVEMPITESVHAILFDGKEPTDALAGLMTRDPKREGAA
ncbi:MAG: Glycerol-3-phosphate dehydrogenase [Phycisphaerales bacterium]|nr:Glycerol-3-phosphate dehydrogenase [Phycisphaerales bacterium]